MKIRNLLPEEYECRVNTIKANGLSLLLYKNARTDMNILDEVFGQDNWCDDYKEVKGNLYCGISVKTKDGWITKWDCGIESRGNDGNEKKGEASDAFKRAGTKWGIGRELYTSPKLIWINANQADIRQGNNGKYNTYDTFSVVAVKVEKEKIVSLIIVNDRSGDIVYRYTDGKKPKPVENKKPVQVNKDLGFTLTEWAESQDNDVISKFTSRVIDTKQSEGVLNALKLYFETKDLRHVVNCIPEIIKDNSHATMERVATLLKNNKEDEMLKALANIIPNIK